MSTGGWLTSLYLFTLAFFLGLDVIRRVPPTLHLALATAMGEVAAVVLVVALPAAGAKSEPWPAGLSVAAVAIATAGLFGGLTRARRMLRERWEREGRR